MYDTSSTARACAGGRGIEGVAQGLAATPRAKRFPVKGAAGCYGGRTKRVCRETDTQRSRSAHASDFAIYSRHHPLFIKHSYLMLLASRLPLRRVVQTGSGTNEGTGISDVREFCHQGSLSSSLLASVGKDALPALVHPLGSSGRAAASARLQLCGAGKPRAVCA